MVVIIRKTTVAWCLILLAAGQAVNAQQMKFHTLSDFIDSAQHHLPLLLQKKALVESSRWGVTDAKHAFLPNAFVAGQVNLGTDNSLPGSYLSYGLVPSTSNGIHAENDYRSATGNIGILQGNYELLDFGYRQARINNARAFNQLTQADLDRETYLLKWQTGKLYFDILKNQFQLAIEKQNVARYEAIYKVIQAVTLSGIKPGADSSLALAELSRSRIAFNQTEGQIQQLKQDLSYITGIAMQDLQIDTTRTKNFLAALDTLSRAIVAENLNNPLTGYYEKQVAFSTQTENLVKKSFLPKLFLNASGWARGSSIDYTGEYKDLSVGLGYQRFNYLFTTTLVYDLFNGVHRKDRIMISHYQTQASNYDLQQAELSIRNTGNKAEEAIRVSIRNLIEIPVQVKASEDTYNQKIAQYKAGIINLIDLTNASFVLYRAQSDYVQTLSDWLLASLDKAAASGNLDSFIQSIR
jgi:outer membrane protein TolC